MGGDVPSHVPDTILEEDLVPVPDKKLDELGEEVFAENDVERFVMQKGKIMPIERIDVKDPYEEITWYDLYNKKFEWEKNHRLAQTLKNDFTNLSSLVFGFYRQASSDQTEYMIQDFFDAFAYAYSMRVWLSGKSDRFPDLTSLPDEQRNKVKKLVGILHEPSMQVKRIFAHVEHYARCAFLTKSSTMWKEYVRMGYL